MPKEPLSISQRYHGNAMPVFTAKQMDVIGSVLARYRREIEAGHKREIAELEKRVRALEAVKRGPRIVDMRSVLPKKERAA